MTKHRGTGEARAKHGRSTGANTEVPLSKYRLFCFDMVKSTCVCCVGVLCVQAGACSGKWEYNTGWRRSRCLAGRASGGWLRVYRKAMTCDTRGNERLVGFFNRVTWIVDGFTRLRATAIAV